MTTEKNNNSNGKDTEVKEEQEQESRQDEHTRDETPKDQGEENKQQTDGEAHDLQEAPSEEEEQQDDAQETDTEKIQSELDELKDKYLRLYAEFENYKKRTLRERVELRKTASREIINALLPVLDDFDRAKKSAEDESTEEVFSEGVELVYNKLYKVLKEQGLQPMESDGKEFDADLHEAVSEVPAPSDDMKGKIIDTIEKGYFLNDRIIRHAKVVVGQ